MTETRGERAAAADLHAEAARALEEYEMPFEQAHALLGHWRCADDGGSLAAAEALFERLGAVVPYATAEEPRAARRAK